MLNLYKWQRDAVEKLHNGSILVGGVGSGKTLTSLVYYFEKICGGKIDIGKVYPMKSPVDLYIITTAEKRNKLDWDSEMSILGMSRDPNLTKYKHTIVVDSWNNIKKYVDVKDAFFIFDEDHVVGSGSWSKNFIKIARKNQWIILSATPGDKWEDYVSVFIANGFYKNRSEFTRQHLVFSRFSKFPKIERYLDTSKLTKLRNQVLVTMPAIRKTVRHDINISVDHDKYTYKNIMKERWNPSKDAPIANISELCYELRKVSNSHPDRGYKVLKILKDHKRAVIFYNFLYELDILKNLDYIDGTVVAELNGKVHDPLPTSDRWVYLVQYNLCEAWNCITADTMIFYSQTYSYKTLEQAKGRIDRMNTPYTDLYYYHLKSYSNIDLAIGRALKVKKTFNEKAFIG